mgnify:CR=1 FL=1
MTDQEIVQALRCCAKGLGHDDACENCKVGEIQDRREYIEFAAANVIERLTAENAALREKVPQWVSVQDRLPEPETDVLIVCNRNGCVFVTPAIYEDGKMLTQESAWNWSDIYGYGLYSEEDDDYYIPEGWWENRQFNPDDVYNNPVDCTVTHWMPLPEAPEEHNGKENS